MTNVVHKTSAPIQSWLPLTHAPTSSSPTPVGDVVTLNVGGTHFSSTHQTLQRSPTLANLLSPHTRTLFVDRDPDAFKHVLSHLRGAKLASTLGASLYDELQREAQYFGLPALGVAAGNELLWQQTRDNKNAAACFDAVEKLYAAQSSHAYQAYQHALEIRDGWEERNHRYFVAESSERKPQWEAMLAAFESHDDDEDDVDPCDQSELFELYRKAAERVATELRAQPAADPFGEAIEALITETEDEGANLSALVDQFAQSAQGQTDVLKLRLLRAWQAGDLAQALDFVLKAAEQAPHDKTLGVVQTALGVRQKNIDATLAGFERIAENDPLEASAWRDVCELYMLKATQALEPGGLGINEARACTSKAQEAYVRFVDNEKTACPVIENMLDILRTRTR